MKSTDRVWDRPVRLLHWALVLVMAAAYWTGSTSVAHEVLGYACAAIVCARIAWGFTGNRYARFPQFLRGPRATWQYASSALAGTASRHIGHNPLGGWMVVALFSTTAALVATGWLYNTDEYWGEAWLANLHAALAWLIVGLVALHVAGVAFTSWRHRENLVAAMFSGRKRPPAPGDIN